MLSQCQAILQSYPEKLHLTYKRRYPILPSPKSEFYHSYSKQTKRPMKYWNPYLETLLREKVIGGSADVHYHLITLIV